MNDPLHALDVPLLSKGDPSRQAVLVNPTEATNSPASTTMVSRFYTCVAAGVLGLVVGVSSQFGLYFLFFNCVEMRETIFDNVIAFSFVWALLTTAVIALVGVPMRLMAAQNDWRAILKTEMIYTVTNLTGIYGACAFHSFTSGLTDHIPTFLFFVVSVAVYSLEVLTWYYYPFERLLKGAENEDTEERMKSTDESLGITSINV